MRKKGVLIFIFSREENTKNDVIVKDRKRRWLFY